MLHRINIDTNAMPASSSALPSRGGYMYWVERAFGRRLGAVNGWFSICTALLDSSSYPAMFCGYVTFALARWTSQPPLSELQPAPCHALNRNESTHDGGSFTGDAPKTDAYPSTPGSSISQPSCSASTLWLATPRRGSFASRRRPNRLPSTLPPSFEAMLDGLLSMFDIVETHGKDSSMRGTAAMESSIARFPSGTVLEVVDDGQDAVRQAVENVLAR